MGSLPGDIGQLKSQPGTLRFGGNPPYSQVVRAESNCVLFWGFEEPTGTPADPVGGHYGTLNGTPTQTDTSLDSTISALPGIGDGLVKCNTTGDYVKTTDSAILSASANGTIAGWARFASVPAGNVFLFGLTDGTSTFPAIWLSSGQVKGSISVGGVQKTVSAANTGVDNPLVANRWYFLALTWTASNCSIYVNGILGGNSTTLGTNNLSYASANFRVGGGAGAGASLADAGAAYYAAVAAYSAAVTSNDLLTTYTLGSSYSPAYARVTDVAIEVARDASVRAARVSNVAIEIVRDSSVRSARVSNLCIEVLRTAAVAQIFTPSATTTIDMGSAGLNHVAYLKTATTTVDMGSAGDEIASFAPSATTTVDLGSAGAEIADFARHATTTIDLTLTADVHNTGPRVSAATTMDLGLDGSENGVFARQATTGVDLGLAGSETADFARHATTQFDFGRFSVTLTPGVVHALATTGLKLIQGPAVHNTARWASATTSIVLMAFPPDILDNTVRKVGPRYVHATTALTIGAAASKTGRFVYRVSAVTSLDLGVAFDAVRLRAYHVQAATGLEFADRAAEVRNVACVATTRMDLGLSGRSGRDIHVHAITALSLGEDSHPNHFFQVTATPTGLVITHHATAIRTGTLAETGLTFTHRADASVWLPWRRGALTRPPGGGLPHE